MKGERLGAAFLTLPLALVFAVPAAAQSRWSVTPYAGILVTDGDLAREGGELTPVDDPPVPGGPDLTIEGSFDVEDAALFGVRVGARLDEAWSVEAGWGYASFPIRLTVVVRPDAGPPETIDFTETDHNLHLWTASARYALPGDRLRPFVAAGIGAARITTSFPILGDVEDLDETATDVLLDLGGGILWSIRDGLAVRVEARDHLQWCDDACLEDDPVLHQVELSGGLEIGL